jgi:HAD superfamily phosphoserine phosphatase-like hydrolase
MKTPIKAIIFDVDGTLTNSSSWQVVTEGLGGDFAQVLHYYKLLVGKQISLQEGTSSVVKAMTVKGPVNKERIAEIYATIPFKNNVEEVIEKLKEKYILCLISGSTDIYLQSVAQHFAIRDYYACSKYVFSAEGKLQDFIYRVDQSEAKVDFLQDFCAKYKFKYEECVAVGDSANDAGLFRLVGSSVFVDSAVSTSELKRLSKFQINDFSELLNIL